MIITDKSLVVIITLVKSHVGLCSNLYTSWAFCFTSIGTSCRQNWALDGVPTIRKWIKGGGNVLHSRLGNRRTWCCSQFATLPCPDLRIPWDLWLHKSRRRVPAR